MTTRAERRAEKLRRPLLRSFRFWVPVGIVLLLLVLALAGVIAGKHVYDRAMAARASLEKALPLATTVSDQLLAGDTEGATATAAQLSELTADARARTDDGVWKGLEWVPVAGPNLQAVRTAAAVTDDLVKDAVTPATSLSLDALKPKDGGIDLAAISTLRQTVGQVSDAVGAASTQLGTIDRGALIPEVEQAVTRLADTVGGMQPMLGTADEILGILPTALGADAPRNYLVIFQNNAESRGTGGNPAALVLITVDKGRIGIAQQASSANFKNARPTPVMPLNPETEALYGDKIGRWISDATLSPDFTETAAIVRAYWAESFGTPVDAVVSFDPVALSYLLAATGPAVVPAEPVEANGQMVRLLDEPVTLTSENAVQILLNDAYFRFDEGYQQDAFFAAAARSVFGILTSGSANPKAMLDSLTRAVDEGRLIYAPGTEEEAALVGDSKLSGRLPATNDDTTTLGVYVDDFTTAKLDYYAQLGITASSTQCTAPDAPAFTVTTTLTNTLAPGDAATLPYAISPARYFPKGNIATDLVTYGPVGATAVSATVDGRPVAMTALPHLGRPAVKVPIFNAPGETRTVTVEFTAPAGEYGDLEVRHTPMVKQTPVELQTPGCG